MTQKKGRSSTCWVVMGMGPLGYTGGKTNEVVTAVGCAKQKGRPWWQHLATTTASCHGSWMSPPTKISPPSVA